MHSNSITRSLVFLLCVIPSVLLSQEESKQQPVTPALFVPTARISGPFDIGLRFGIEPGWYLYWINPGDAGLPVDVQWNLPEGWTAGPVRFPTPEKFIKGGITAYGYHDELVLLCRITPEKKADRDGAAQIAAKLDWLVCRESCLPGTAEVTLPLEKEALERSAIPPERMRQLLDRFPIPLDARGLRVRSLKVHPDGVTSVVRISVTGDQAAEITDFYPEPIEGFSTDLPSIQVVSGEITLRLTPQSESSVLESVRGIAMLGTKGYLLAASVQQ